MDFENGDSNYVQPSQETKAIDDACLAARADGNTAHAATARAPLKNDSIEKCNQDQYYRVETKSAVSKFPKPPHDGPRREKIWKVVDNERPDA